MIIVTLFFLLKNFFVSILLQQTVYKLCKQNIIEMLRYTRLKNIAQSRNSAHNVILHSKTVSISVLKVVH